MRKAKLSPMSIWLIISHWLSVFIIFLLELFDWAKPRGQLTLSAFPFSINPFSVIFPPCYQCKHGPWGARLTIIVTHHGCIDTRPHFSHFRNSQIICGNSNYTPLVGSILSSSENLCLLLLVIMLAVKVNKLLYGRERLAVSVNISIIVMRGGHWTLDSDHWPHIPRLCWHFWCHFPP